MSRSLMFAICVLALPLMACGEERSPDEWIRQFAAQWDDTAWQPGYMRPLDDQGWQARMLAMHGIATNGKNAVKPLVVALQEGTTPTRILSAQLLGFLAPHVPRDALITALSGDPDAAVRLYAVDALGMQGGQTLIKSLGPRKREELLDTFKQPRGWGGLKNADVVSHINYAIERGEQGMDESVYRTLVEWNPSTIDSAKVGKPAPEFALTTVSGKKYRLSDFRGKQAIILVFVYGDT